MSFAPGPGPTFPCLDAMVLIHYNSAGRLSDLEALWPAGAWTPEVIRQEEIGANLTRFPANHAIMNSPWLHEKPVSDPRDVVFAQSLRRLWQSEHNKDRGEADIVTLCRKEEWTAITDDKNGRAALDDHGCNFSYMSSMLLAAAACGHADLDADAAWDLHYDVESRRNGPRIHTERVFKQLVPLIATLRTQLGDPPWYELLADPRVDLLVDAADRRRPSRKAPAKPPTV